MTAVPVAARRGTLVASLAALALATAPSTVWAASAGGTLDFLYEKDVDPSGTTGSVDACEFSRDGSLMVVGDLHAEARLYRVSDGTFVRKVTHKAGLFGTAGELNAIGFSHDDSLFLTGIDNEGVKIWRTSDGTLFKHLAQGKSVDGADFSADGKWFGTAAGNQAVIYSLPGYTAVATITHASGAEVNSLDFSRDSQLLATAGGTGDERIKIIRTSDWKELRSMSVGGSVKSVRLSPDKSLVTAGARDQHCRVYRVSDGVRVADLTHAGNMKPLSGDDQDSNPAIEAVAWSQDGRYLFSSGLIDGVMRVWRVADWSLVDWVQAQEAKRGIEYIDVSVDDKVVVGGDEGSVHLYQFDPPALKEPIGQGSDGLVSIEVEDFDTNLRQGGHAWSVASDSSSSGGTKLRALPDSGVNKDSGYQTYDPLVDSPKLDYRIDFVKTGIHHVWLRGKGGDSGNSVHVGLDGVPLQSADRLQFGDGGTSSWLWVSQTKDGAVATIDVGSVGPHTLNVWMREDGTEIDKIVVASSSSYVPSGSGPAASPRGSSTPDGDVDLKVNFQPGGAPAVSGYLVDSGASYAARNGQTYGWSAGNTGSTRDRNASNSPDQRHDTLAHLQVGGSFTWEIAVPDGSYRVTVLAGDPTYIDSVYRLAVEGVTVVDGTPTSSERWIEGTATVTVTDGRLTLSSASGSVNNKVCSIAITAAAPAGISRLDGVPADGPALATMVRRAPDGRSER